MMARLQRLQGALLRFYFQPFPAAPAALIRIGLGLVMFLAWLEYLPRLEFFYGSEGLAHYVAHGGRSSWVEAHLWPLYGVLMGSALLFCVGLFTRVSGAVLALCQIRFINDYSWYTWGWATVIPLFLGYLVLADAGRWWSVDSWWRARRRRARGMPPEEGPRVVHGLGMRLLQLNISAVYLAAAWHRVNDESWVYGDIVWEAVTSSIFTRWPHIDVQFLKPVLLFSTYAAWSLEGLGVVLLWVPRFGPWWALGCLSMHVGLEVADTVGWWQFTMGTALFSFLWPSVSERILRLGRAPIRA